MRTAKTVNHWNDGEEMVCWWAEVEPDLWLGVSRQAVSEEDFELARQLAEGDVLEDGRRQLPLKFHTRYLHYTTNQEGESLEIFD